MSSPGDPQATVPLFRCVQLLSRREPNSEPAHGAFSRRFRHVKTGSPESLASLVGCRCGDTTASLRRLRDRHHVHGDLNIHSGEVVCRGDRRTVYLIAATCDADGLLAALAQAIATPDDTGLTATGFPDCLGVAPGERSTAGAAWWDFAHDVMWTLDPQIAALLLDGIRKQVS